MKKDRYLELILNLEQYSSAIIKNSNTFVGPSIYFHQKALEYQEKEFLSDRHIEYVYATLVAWGMHRMGQNGAKMPEYDVFKSSILDPKIRKAIEELKEIRIENIATNEIDSIIKKLNDICFSIKGSISNSHLVSSSKILAHILPNLVCPIDRQYTCTFFGVYLNAKNEQAFFKEVMCTMWNFYQNSNNIQSVKSLLGKTFSENYPKIFDNLIIEYINHENAHRPKKKQKKP